MIEGIVTDFLSPTRTIRNRYESDPHFRLLVSTLHNEIEYARFTPTEIREATMLAQIMYEERHLRPVYFSKEDVMAGRV